MPTLVVVKLEVIPKLCPTIPHAYILLPVDCLAPVFCTKCYESSVWVTGKGLCPRDRLGG